MKKLVLLITLLCAGLVVAQAEAKTTDGEVVAATGMECSDYFVVKTDDGYAVLEWYSGYKPDEGDKVSGEFGLFGYRDISVQPGGANIHAWVEDYGLSLDDANDKLKGKCN